MLPLRTQDIGRAFDDPVQDAQSSFRALLAAMSEPGTIHRLTATVEPPLTLHCAAAICLLTLADQDTPIWLAQDFGAQVAGFLRFHCGAPLTQVPGEAGFALANIGDDIDLSAFHAGEDKYPDRSATVVIQCPQLTGGTVVTLAGPGIRGMRSVAPLGVTLDLWRQIAANHARYSLGVDLLLTSGAELMALPRSVSITTSKGLS